MPEFDKPLDTDIIEEREVERSVIVPDGKDESGRSRFRFGTVKDKVQETVRYTRAEPKPFSCKDGHHHWQMIDTHKHIAKCSNCTKHRVLRAAFEFVDSAGHLVDRDTNTLID